MPLPTDIRPIATELYYLPIRTRTPLKFGPESLTHVTVLRVKLTVRGVDGREVEGWGETPLSVQWVWPSAQPYEPRLAAMRAFCGVLGQAWANFDATGHAFEVGHEFIEEMLPVLLARFNAGEKEKGTKGSRDQGTEGKGGRHESGVRGQGSGGDAWTITHQQSAISNQQSPSPQSPMPWLAALVCCSAFDLALHDAFGRLCGRPVYETYTREFLSRDLSHYLAPAEGAAVSFAALYPCDFLVARPATVLPAWHLVGGLDLLDAAELTGDRTREPDDGYPLVLPDWIERDGLRCLKVKLRGNDAAWDYARLVSVGRIALTVLRRQAANDGGAAQDTDSPWLTADFNCTVTDPAYVNDILDRLRDEHPRIHQMMLYVEQPFPYDLEEHRIDVHSVAARKPLFMDESAHDWKLVKLGRSLGWTGVALKTCKTQTGALLTLCWAKAHGMTLMVQDLTNPMLAQIPHVLLAAHAGTIMGVETNAPQFYPDASKPEAAVHPGLYQRRDGCVNLATIRGPGFGYRLEEMQRELQPSRPEC